MKRGTFQKLSQVIEQQKGEGKKKSLKTSPFSLQSLVLNQKARVIEADSLHPSKSPVFKPPIS